jgi:hypothetical protein
MSRPSSGLYEGVVAHSRLRPRRHRLRYRIFMLLLDLDELEVLDRERLLFGHNRAALISFHDRDHGDGSGPLRPQIERRLAEAGLPAGGAIRILCMPRVMGAAFNPLSEIFCHHPDGRLMAIVHQVTNTFGQRHSYLLPAAAAAAEGEAVRQACDKRFYVSPFMDMGLSYDFDIVPPGERTSIAIRVGDAEGLMLSASFTAARRPLTDANLLEAWLSHPLLMLKVLAGIHWEALRLWLKGVRLRRRPPPPADAFTIARPAAKPKARAA